MKVGKNIFSEYDVFDGSLNQISFDRKTVINTINQYSFCVAEHDALFKNALRNSDILLPDGVGIVVALRSTLGRAINKISGDDLHQFLLDKLNTGRGSCFYLGSSVKTLEKIQARLDVEFPDIKCNSFSPPYKSEFSESDSAEMIARINECSPDVLFVGMTAPKQEKWVNDHKHQINAKVICCIGAVFDFYAGTVKRPCKVWVDFGLEWFVRLCKEPKRMWKRYVYYGPIFAFKIIKEVVKNDLVTITANGNNF